MLDEETIQSLRRVSRELARELGVIGERHPAVQCSVTEGHVLIEVDDSGMLTVGELAERLSLDKSTTSRAVSSLIARRCLSESTDSRDHRRKHIGLTKPGRRMVNSIHQHATNHVRSALAFLSPQDAEDILRASRLYTRALRTAAATRDIVIRPVTRKDNGAVMMLIRDTRIEHRPIIGDDAPTIENTEQDIHALYSAPRRSFFVIELRDQIVGGGGFGPLDGAADSVCELQRMYFRPAIRGLGIGYKLLSECLAAATDAGYSTCYAETMAGMERANRLYLKSGFRKLESPLGDTGHAFTDAWFLKDLS